MSRETFTSGPRHLGGNGSTVYSADGHGVADDVANAKMRAAAPCLVAALRSVYRSEIDLPDSLVDEIRAALALAGVDP